MPDCWTSRRQANDYAGCVRSVQRGQSPLQRSNRNIAPQSVALLLAGVNTTSHHTPKPIVDSESKVLEEATKDIASCRRSRQIQIGHFFRRFFFVFFLKVEKATGSRRNRRGNGAQEPLARFRFAPFEQAFATDRFFVEGSTAASEKQADESTGPKADGGWFGCFYSFRDDSSRRRRAVNDNVKTREATEVRRGLHGSCECVCEQKRLIREDPTYLRARRGHQSYDSDSAEDGSEDLAGW